MLLVTGAAGFIGSNLVHALNALGEHEVVAVDDLSDGTKFKNLGTAALADYLDKDQLFERLEDYDFQAIFHQGACSATTEWNGKFVMEVNFEYSKRLFHYAQAKKIPFIYASSASVYGMGGAGFKEDLTSEQPLNMYAYSKFLFDQYVRRELRKDQRRKRPQVVGLRYFNVYGPREAHKGSMASVAFHQHHQLLKEGEVRLFEGSDGYGNGEQRRDFIHVDDVVALNLWFWQHPKVSGIFNAGTGRAQSFNEVAQAVLNWHWAQGREGQLRYIPFPEHLKGRYQSFTEADLSQLRAVGCQHAFLDVQTGVSRYLDWLGQYGA